MIPPLNRAHYQFNFYPWLENRVDQLADWIAVQIVGHRLTEIEEIHLPNAVSEVNAAQTQADIQQLMKIMSSTGLCAEEVSRIQNIFHQNVDQPLSWADNAYRLLRKVRRLLTPVQASYSLDIVNRANTRAQEMVTNLSPKQKADLAWKPRIGLIEEQLGLAHSMRMGKHEVFAQIFNLATLNFMGVFTLAFFGIIGLKTALLAAAFFCGIRHIADHMVAVTNYDATTLPMAMRIPLTSLTTLSPVAIPTRRGLRQIADRVHNYVASYFYTASVTEMVTEEMQRRTLGFETAEQRENIWYVIRRVLPTDPTTWRPNFLTIVAFNRSIVVFKNSTINFRLIYPAIQRAQQA